MKAEDKRKNESNIPNSDIFTIDDSIPSFLKKPVNCVVRINISNKVEGTGFFIKLRRNNKDFYCLMSCSHVIQEEYIKSKETLTIMDKKSREFKIKLDERFIKDFNKDLKIDAIIIEIKNEDGIDRKDFLRPDRSYEKGYDQFINKNIYILQYPSNKPFSYSKNIIKSIPDEIEFAHLASTGPGSSGSPIFLENSEFVLGIHKQGYNPNRISVNGRQNYGNFIGPIVDYFEPNKIMEKNHINKKKTNEIMNFNITTINENINEGGDYHNFKEDIDDKNVEELIDNQKKIWKFLKEKKYVFPNLVWLLLIVLGVPILIVILVYVLSSDDSYKCKIFNFNLIYHSNFENEEITLINSYFFRSYFLDYVSYMTIDDEVKSPSDKYTFHSKGNHSVEFFLKENKRFKSMKYMFMGITKLKSVTIKFRNDTVIDMSYMFYDCSELVSVNFSIFNSKNVEDMSWMFYGCTSLKTIDISNLNTEKVTNMNTMFYDCASLTSINLSNFETKNVENMSWMFAHCLSLKSIKISNFNTDKVIYMDNMFLNCSSLTSINISNFNTENVKNMESMFLSCSSLKSINISNFTIEKVTNMNTMFDNCTSLTSINISNFNTKNVEDMEAMFSRCSSLKLIDISNFNTEKVTNMQNMFIDCTSLASINISHFNIKNVKNMARMFYNCSSLTSINISNFNTRNLEIMDEMFYYCSSLKYIDISNFIINKEKAELFYDLPKEGTIKINNNSKNKFEIIPSEWKIIDY